MITLGNTLSKKGDKQIFPTQAKIPFIIGILICIIVVAGYRIFSPPVDARTARIAKLMEADPRTIQKLDQLTDSVRSASKSSTSISEKQWRDLVSAFNNPNENIQNEAMSAMMFLGNSSHRNEIIAMVQPRLEAKNVFVQLNAVTLLRRYKDPSWRFEAEKRTKSSDKDMREIATGMIESGDIK